MSPKRKLAAIMFTDIEGYTALMQADEAEAIAIRKRHREIFETVTRKHKGKIVQYYGDGTLSLFRSAKDAVRCGIELQVEFRKDPSIPVRIGIHTGDVVIREHDIIGDVVNLSSRIESLAIPGSVLISDKLYDELKNHSDIEVEYLGEFDLKNIKQNIGIYAVKNQGLAIPSVGQIAAKGKGKLKRTTKRWVSTGTILKFGVPASLLLIVVVFLFHMFTRSELSETGDQLPYGKSVAVLAFENMSNDPDQEYFSDGISEQILNELAKISELKVAGRTSSFTYKGKSADLQEIGDRLKVSFVLEGSVRKEGDLIRVTAQLIKTSDGYHVWSEQYDRNYKNILYVQEEIAKEISDILETKILEIKQPEAVAGNEHALENYMKGMYFLTKDAAGTEQALDYFSKAIRADSAFGLAYAGLAAAYVNMAFYEFMKPRAALTNARTASIKAIELSGDNGYSHEQMAYVHMFLEWDWENARKKYDIVKSLGHKTHFGQWYNSLLFGEFELAIEQAKEYVANDPFSVEENWHLGVMNYLNRDYEGAIRSFKEATELFPSYSDGYFWLGKCYLKLGDTENALSNWDKGIAVAPNEASAKSYRAFTHLIRGEESEFGLLLEDMIASRDTVQPDYLPLTRVYIAQGDLDRAFEMIRYAMDDRALWVLSLKYSPDWDAIREDPRFVTIIEEIDYPEEGRGL